MANNVFSTLFLVAFLLAGPANKAQSEVLPIDQENNKRAVAFAVEGEDATSASYYFYYNLPGDEVAKVRMLWDGGATNKPTMTDYYITATFILIVERTAERADLPLLRKGKDAAFQTTKERLIKTVPKEVEANYTFPQVAEVARGSETEREDLTTLVSLLAKTRKPIRGR